MTDTVEFVYSDNILIDSLTHDNSFIINAFVFDTELTDEAVLDAVFAYEGQDKLSSASFSLIKEGNLVLDSVKIYNILNDAFPVPVVEVMSNIFGKHLSSHADVSYWSGLAIYFLSDSTYVEPDADGHMKFAVFDRYGEGIVCVCSMISRKLG